MEFGIVQFTSDRGLPPQILAPLIEAAGFADVTSTATEYPGGAGIASASVVAINLAYLIAGVVVVEVVFVYPGIGQTMVDAVRNRDVPVVQACALIFSATYIILNLVADIISIVSNPRLLHPR